MEPRIQNVQIQYAPTKDGTGVTFYALGHGSPLIYTQGGPLRFLELAAAQATPYRSFLDELAKSRTVIAYERGEFAVSDKERENPLEAWAGELTAVADRLALDRFDLFGWGFHSSVAIAYAAWNPERVSRLVLFCPATSGSELIGSPRDRVLGMLMDTDWELWTEVMAHMSLGWEAGKAARMFAASMREGSTPDEVRALNRVAAQLDATELVSDVTCPVLILHSRRHPFTRASVVREIAAKLPDARLTLLDGDSVSPYVGEVGDAVIEAINKFLGEGEEAEAKAELPEGMAVILFADIANSTALTEQLGDAAFREKARELDTSLRTTIGESGGTPVEGKVLGDGVLAVFTSARQAIDCALRCNTTSEPLELQLHLGIHAGDVIREGNNVYGGAVNIAARIAGASAPGEVLVSDTVRSLARTSAGVAYDDRGEHELKGVADPQRLFAVKGGG